MAEFMAKTVNLALLFTLLMLGVHLEIGHLWISDAGPISLGAAAAQSDKSGEETMKRKLEDIKKQTPEEEDKEIHAGMNAEPSQPQPDINPLLYKHQYRHLSLRTGMYTNLEYSAELAHNLVLLDKHLPIQTLECETVGPSVARKRGPDTSAQGLELGTSPDEHRLQVEIMVPTSSTNVSALLVKDAVFSGGKKWGECFHNNTHRRSEQPFLHRISTTPRVLRDVDEGTTTYTFEAEPAEMHEMFKDMEFSYFHGHHSQHASVKKNIGGHDGHGSPSKVPSAAGSSRRRLQDDVPHDSVEADLPEGHHNSSAAAASHRRSLLDLCICDCDCDWFSCSGSGPATNIRVSRNSDNVDFVVAGTEIEITWTPRGSGDVKIALYEDDAPLSNCWRVLKTVNRGDRSTTITIPANIHDLCTDPTSFPEYYVWMYRPGKETCGEKSRTFHIAYNFFDEDRSLNLMDSDKVSITDEISLKMSMAGDALAYVYLKTGNFNPFEKFIAYAKVDAGMGSQADVTLEYARRYAEFDEGVLLERQGIPYMTKTLNFFGIQLFIGLQSAMRWRLTMTLEIEAAVTLEVVDESQVEALGRFEYTLGRSPVQQKSYSIQVGDFKEPAVNFYFKVNGTIILDIIPEVYCGVWAWAGPRNFLTAYAMMDYTFFIKAQAIFQLPNLGQLANADGYASKGCRGTQVLRFGVSVGGRNMQLHTVLEGEVQLKILGVTLYEDELEKSEETYALGASFGPWLLFGVCFLEGWSAGASAPPPSPPPPRPPPQQAALCSYFNRITVSTGEFSDSSSASSNYMSNTDCFWAVQPTGGDRIQLNERLQARSNPPLESVGRLQQEFTRFSTERNYDTVIIYDCLPNYGSDTTPDTLKRLGLVYSSCSWAVLAEVSGELASLPPEQRRFSSSSSYGLVLHFTSDSSVTYTGWTASFSPLLSCATGYANANAAMADLMAVNNYAGGFPFIFDPADANAFSDHIQDSSGDLTDYAPGTDCWWAIVFPEYSTNGQPASLGFTRFATEQGYDIVRVYSADPTAIAAPPPATYDGDKRRLLSHDDDSDAYYYDSIGNSQNGLITKLGEFSGDNSSAFAVQTSAPYILVNFKSDSSVQRSGFSASYGLGWDFCNTVTQLDATGAQGNSVSFAEYGEPNVPYRPGLSCTWLILLPEGSASGITLRLDVAALYPNDRVQVYMGNTSDPGAMISDLGNGTNGAQQEVRACSTSVLIQFISYDDDEVSTPSGLTWGLSGTYTADTSACSDPDAPVSWVCPPEFYGAGDECDCSCGAHDPDCDVAGTTVRGCEQWAETFTSTAPSSVTQGLGIVCSSDDICKYEPPSDWTCKQEHFGSDDGCHCECGTYDPDCSLLFSANHSNTVYKCDEFCPVSYQCGDRNCDEWVASGYSCAVLTNEYGCNCAGCDCSSDGYSLLGNHPCFNHAQHAVGNGRWFLLAYNNETMCREACDKDSMCTAYSLVYQSGSEYCILLADYPITTLEYSHMWDSGKCYVKQAPPPPLCSNRCHQASDGICDDGGENSLTSMCEYGSDCYDCNARPYNDRPGEPTFFVLTEGDCQLETGGSCITSPGYIDQFGNTAQSYGESDSDHTTKAELRYPHNARCRIYVNNAALLQVVAFDLEEDYDFLNVYDTATGMAVNLTGRGIDNTLSRVNLTQGEWNWDWNRFESQKAPTSFHVRSGTWLTFSSDGSVNGKGFQICTEQAACDKLSLLTFQRDPSWGPYVSSGVAGNAIGSYQRGVGTFEFCSSSPMYTCLSCNGTSEVTMYRDYDYSSSTYMWYIGYGECGVGEIGSLWRVSGTANVAEDITEPWSQRVLSSSWKSQSLVQNGNFDSSSSTTTYGWLTLYGVDNLDSSVAGWDAQYNVLLIRSGDTSLGTAQYPGSDYYVALGLWDDPTSTNNAGRDAGRISQYISGLTPGWKYRITFSAASQSASRLVVYANGENLGYVDDPPSEFSSYLVEYTLPIWSKDGLWLEFMLEVDWWHLKIYNADTTDTSSWHSVMLANVAMVENEGAWVERYDMQLSGCYRSALPYTPQHLYNEQNVTTSSAKRTFCALDATCTRATVPTSAECDWNIYATGDGICPLPTPPTSSPTSRTISPTSGPAATSSPSTQTPTKPAATLSPTTLSPSSGPAATNSPSTLTPTKPTETFAPTTTSPSAAPTVTPPSPSPPPPSPPPPPRPSPPPPSPSPPPPSPLPPPPSPSPPPPYVVVPAVESTIRFATMNLDDLLADPTAGKAFNDTFKADVAASAGVTPDDVEILSITSGSVQVTSKVYFNPATVTTASTPDAAADAFVAVLQTDAAAVFSESFRKTTGDIAVDTTSLRVTQAVVYTPPVLSPPLPLALALSTATPIGPVAAAVPAADEAPAAAPASMAPIAGGAAGGGVLVILIAVVYYKCCRKPSEDSKPAVAESGAAPAIVVTSQAPAPATPPPPPVPMMQPQLMSPPPAAQFPAASPTPYTYPATTPYPPSPITQTASPPVAQMTLPPPQAQEAPRLMAQTFLAQIPPGTKPGTELNVIVPPGYTFGGSTMKYVVPQDVPADRMVHVPILAENLMSGYAQPALLAPPM